MWWIIISVYLFVGCLIGWYLRNQFSWGVGEVLFFIATWPICLFWALIEYLDDHMCNE